MKKLLDRLDWYIDCKIEVVITKSYMRTQELCMKIIPKAKKELKHELMLAFGMKANKEE
jgi:hypothetical protein